MMLRPDILDNCLDNSNVSWVSSLLTQNAYLTAAILRVELPAICAPDAPLQDVIYRWFDVFKHLHSACRRLPPVLFPEVKSRSIPQRAADGQISSDLLGCGPLLPLAADDKHDIAFVLPVVAYGGVEKVAFHVAEQFHRSGWRCHLLVLSKEATISEPWLSMFDSIAFYYEEDFYQWSDSRQYLGTTYPKWVSDGDTRSLEGLLLPMDAVINFHSGALHNVIHKLRKSGVVTAVSLHVNDMSPFGREVGHPFLALGHEHVYDFFVPCSQTLFDWCHAMGVPRDKLLLVPNAPAHDIASDEIADLLARRAAKNKSRRGLNVLFLGRLDRQKGLDRIAAMVRRTRSSNLPIAWRIVGSTIVEGAEASLLCELDDLIKPPIHDPTELTELYEWADVLLMPSHWEGLPLAIMEAARLGVVPVASRVGAIPEIVEHEKTGLLLDDAPCDEFAAAAIKVLQTLAEDRPLLTRLSLQAAAAMRRTWHTQCEELIDRVNDQVERSRRSPRRSNHVPL